ncbi:MAG: Ig-like domain-containing protein, partial [Athalassotoga sp.]|uniref:Ig-like domain-containing protein n=1 Tax=Athalassotoga sp. TaxID=2022597 RepID=UPI003D00431A
MSKKILGLVVSVALLMVVLSGCFLLPQIDTFTPLVTIVSPAPSQTITVPTSTSSTNVTVTATVLAHSPIQSVQISLVQNGQNYGTFNMSGAFGQNTGSFSYTFTNLPVGSYYLTVTAQSQAKTPGSASQKFSIVSAQPVTPPSTKYAAPVVSLINVAPNYQGKYYVAQAPITFSATVTNPNKVGQLAVWASVNGQTIQPNSNSNPYTFTWTPSATGTYTLSVNATVTIGASTVSGSNSVVVKVPFINPSANVTGIPSRLVMASTTPASFTFTTTSGVNAYLSINGGVPATYTSQSPIANSKLLPNQWNTLTLTFKDPWGYTIQTAVATVLGVQTSNTSQTPYIFLIDKSGHVVSNTNDWINITAGASIDLYGYILAGSQQITSFNLTQQYFTSKMLTTSIAGPGTVLSGSYTTPQNIVPIKLLAYLFNPQVAP